MNIAYFQVLLQKAIDNATSTIDYLLLAKAIQSLNMGQIRSVSTFANLPDATTNEGLLVFVDADETLYWSTGQDWFSISSAGKGLLYGWGRNNFSGITIGDETCINRSSPVLVAGGISNWCQVDGACRHVVAIGADGKAWAWGQGGNGRLGQGSYVSTTQSSPVSVSCGFTDWCQVSAGKAHSLGVRKNGTAWGWGLDNNGQLGIGFCSFQRWEPTLISGGFTDWKQVAAGSFYHSVGVRENGTAWSWGANCFGALGNDTSLANGIASPVSVAGGFTDWCQVTAGCRWAQGVRTNGTAWGWGLNSVGFIGDGESTTKSSPSLVVGGFTDWCQISAGNSHTLGIRTNGTAWGWGNQSGGAIGNGFNYGGVSSPMSVVGGFTDWCQVSAGEQRQSLGVRVNNTLWSWGYGSNGQLGNDSTSGTCSPVSVAGGFTDWCHVGAGYVSHAIRQTDFT